jgi:hypothetical protein
MRSRNASNSLAAWVSQNATYPTRNSVYWRPATESMSNAKMNKKRIFFLITLDIRRIARFLLIYMPY